MDQAEWKAFWQSITPAIDDLRNSGVRLTVNQEGPETVDLWIGVQHGLRGQGLGNQALTQVLGIIDDFDLFVEIVASPMRLEDDPPELPPPDVHELVEWYKRHDFIPMGKSSGVGGVRMKRHRRSERV